MRKGERFFFLSDVLKKVTDPVVQKRGFASSELILAWPELVGPIFSECTWPERILWPSGKQSEKQKDACAPETATDALGLTGGGGGILIVQMESATSVLFQHTSSQLIARINDFLGWSALAGIRIRPNVPEKAWRNHKAILPKENTLSPPQEQKLAALLAPICDEKLRAALHSLGKEILTQEKDREVPLSGLPDHPQPPLEEKKKE